MNKLSIIIFATCVLFLGGQLFAATNSTTSKQSINLSANSLKDLILIQATPDTPHPGDNVHIQIESSTADLNRSEITWSINGVVKTKQIGLKTFDVIAGKLGEKTTISASALTPLGTTAQAQVSFTPNEVDLIWQADTYTPPFYKGKAMFSTQSDLEIIALPDVPQNGNVGNFIYTWTHNGEILGDQSGYGRNTLTLPAIDLPRDVHIDVTATNYSESNKAVGSIIVPPLPPKALIYEDNPRFGLLLNKALVGDADMQDQEIHLTSFPYFFSPGTNKGSLNYEWNANDQNIPNFTNNNIILRNADDKTGSSALHLVLKNNERFLQYADTYLNLHFTSKKQ